MSRKDVSLWRLKQYYSVSCTYYLIYILLSTCCKNIIVFLNTFVNNIYFQIKETVEFLPLSGFPRLTKRRNALLTLAIITKADNMICNWMNVHNISNFLIILQKLKNKKIRKSFTFKFQLTSTFYYLF